MAGLGVKLFQDGVVLTAAEVNGYLMDQAVAVFEDEQARTEAFGELNEPTISEGRICYLKNKKIIEYYNGSIWVNSPQFSIALNSQVGVGILQPDRLVSGSPGQILVCNASGVPAYVTLTNDATINSSGQLTIGNTALILGSETVGDYVERIAGTANQITVTGSGAESASVTLSLPQDIHTSANPTFAGTTSGSVRVGITADNEIDTTSGNLILDSTGGTVNIDDILSVSGSAAISGAASVAGLLTAASNLLVSGSAAVSGAASVASNLTVSGSAAVSGAASVAGLLTAANNVNVSGSVSIVGNAIYHISTASIASTGSLSTSNDGQLVELTGNNATLTVPGTGWTVGSQVTIMQMGTGSASITFTGATDIKAEPRVSASVVALRTQYSTATIINRGTNDWYVIGDLRK